MNFLTNTRLDIAFSVQHLSQFMQDPRTSHLQAAFHLLRYLKQDPTLGLHLTKDPDCSIKAYCDSDWASCPDSRRSVSGYLVLLGNNPISCKSKKQETISLSFAEAEYRSIRKVVGELVWLHRLTKELTISDSSPIPVFCDSQSAIHIAHNPVSMREPSILKSIVTLYAANFRWGSFHYITFPLLNSRYTHKGPHWS